MKRIPLFKLGGWLNSYNGAFNQPSSYVGIKYAPVDPDVPSLDGLKYFLEEQAKQAKEHEAYRKAASPDDEAFNKLLEKAKGPSGQINQKVQEYYKLKQLFHNQFKGDDVFSDEAKRVLSGINSIFNPGTFNELERNQKILDEQLELMKKNEVDGDIWTDGSNVLVRDTKTNKADVVSISSYTDAMADKEFAGRFQALTNRQAYDWKDKNWDFNSPDKFILGDQWSLKKTNEYIDDFFKGVGHKGGGSGGEQITNIQNFLSKQGINLEAGNVIQQVNSKYKNNKEQLAYVQQRIYDSLPSTAKNAFISHLISEGVDPFAKQKIKAPDGNEIEVSNVSQYMSRLVGSAVGSRRIDEYESSFGLKSMGSVSSSDSGNGKDGFILDQIAAMMLDPEKFGGDEIKMKSPDILRKGEEIDAYAVPMRGDLIRERFPDLTKLNVVTKGKKVFINGIWAWVGTNKDPKNPKKWVDLPTFQSYIVPMQETNGFDEDTEEPIKITRAYVQREALVNKKTLESLNKEYGGNFIEIPWIGAAKGLGDMSPNIVQIGLEDALKMSGATPEEIEAGKAAFEFEDDVHKITYWEPYSEFDLNQDLKDPVQKKNIEGIGQQFLKDALKKQQKINQAKEQKSNLTVR